MRADDSRCPRQRADTDDGQLRHTSQCDGRLYRASEARCVQPILRGDYTSQRRRSTGYPSCGGSGRVVPLAPAGQNIRATERVLSAAQARHSRQALAGYPYLPYLTFAPSAFVFPLKFTGGGVSGGGKLMFDSEGNAWVADNFSVGAQNQDASSTGNVSKFAPNGKPLSPSPLGFSGGGLAGPGFGLAVDAQTTRGSPALPARTSPGSIRAALRFRHPRAGTLTGRSARCRASSPRRAATSGRLT